MLIRSRRLSAPTAQLVAAAGAENVCGHASWVFLPPKQYREMAPIRILAYTPPWTKQSLTTDVEKHHNHWTTSRR